MAREEWKLSEPPRKTLFARLDAERAGVGRDIGPGFVDHADDSDRHAHLADQKDRWAASHSSMRAPTGRAGLRYRRRLGHRARRVRHPTAGGPAAQRHAGFLRGLRYPWRWREDGGLFAADQARRLLSARFLASVVALRRTTASRRRATAQLRPTRATTSSAACQSVHRPFQYRPNAHSTTRSSRWTISPAAKAQQALDLALFAPRDAAASSRHRPPGRAPARGRPSLTSTTSPRRNSPSMLVTPAGSRLLPADSARTAPSSTVSAPRRLERPAIHFLRADRGEASEGTSCSAPCRRSAHPARRRRGRRDRHAATGRHGDAAGQKLGRHGRRWTHRCRPARPSPRWRRDLADLGNERGRHRCADRRCRARRCRQQHQRVGRDHLGHAALRRSLREADLVGCHRVLLVITAQPSCRARWHGLRALR